MSGCFLYIILTAHYIKYDGQFVNLLGYGITIQPKKRSKQYSDHSGIDQEFAKLFFGPLLQIKALEAIIKQRLATKSHKIYGERVEWVSPKHKFSVDDLYQLIVDTINEENLDISVLNEDYLPFNNLDHHKKITIKELNSNPNAYLTKVKIDK